MGDRPILILGATGGFGGAVLAQALARGRQVRALARNAHEARGRLGAPVGLEWVTGDGRDAASVLRAAQGASAIVHGIDVAPGERLAVLPAIAACVAAAARETGIPVVLPGSVHPLGRPGADAFGEGAPIAPVSGRGRAEAEVMARLGDGTRLLTLRAGWHFGPGMAGGPAAGMFAALRVGRSPWFPGDASRPQAWSFLPDLACAALDLLGRDWQGSQVVHGPTLDMAPSALARDIARAAGHPGAGLRRRPWWQMRLAALADPVARDLVEQRYLWDGGVRLAPGRLATLLPGFVATDADQAIARTLAR